MVLKVWLADPWGPGTFSLFHCHTDGTKAATVKMVFLHVVLMKNKRANSKIVSFQNVLDEVVKLTHWVSSWPWRTGSNSLLGDGMGGPHQVLLLGT